MRPLPAGLELDVRPAAGSPAQKRDVRLGEQVCWSNAYGQLLWPREGSSGYRWINEWWTNKGVPEISRRQKEIKAAGSNPDPPVLHTRGGSIGRTLGLRRRHNAHRWLSSIAGIGPEYARSLWIGFLKPVSVRYDCGPRVVTSDLNRVSRRGGRGWPVRSDVPRMI